MSALTAALQPTWGLHSFNKNKLQQQEPASDAAGVTVPAEAPINPPMFASATSLTHSDSMIDLADIFDDDFLLPEDSPLYEGNLEDSQEIMQLLSGMEAEGSTVRTSARIKSKRSSSSIFNGDDDDESYGSNEGGIQKKKKLSKSTGSSNKPVTDQQRIERRERNREHAKRSRMRKKFMLESLSAQMLALRRENLRLRQLVKGSIPDKAEAILEHCSGDTSALLKSHIELGHQRDLTDSDVKLVKALKVSQQNFTISDPSLPDNPIVYASEGFLKLTGYTREQVLGRNCRFLQGPGTDRAAVELIKRGIAQGTDTSVCLLNYRADGTPFWNQFFVASLRDSEGNIINHVGVQCEVEEAPLDDEWKARVKEINFDETD